MKSYKLASNMLLGCATSATQIEGGDKNNSWYQWCQQGKITDKSSCYRANEHWERYKEDIDLMATMGMEVYRMGLEWSRIEPMECVFDYDAITHYREELSYLISKGIKPLVTLHHFSNPLWFENKGAFENKECVRNFENYVKFVVEHLGDLCNEWITINEPNVYVTNGYVFGTWPPGKKSIIDAFKVFRNLTLCHIASYKQIHNIHQEKNFKGDAMVGFANHLRVFIPYNAKSPFNKLSSRIMEYMFQGAITKSMSTGKLKFPIGFGSPLGAGKYYDFIGVNYYTRSTIRGFKDDVMPNTLRNDLNWEIYPQGIGELIKELYNKYEAPIWITENGTCDCKDRFRAKYIYDHIYELQQLELPIERYYHWSFMDNFEWLEGESACFGLVKVDYETQSRTVRKSGEFYSEVIKNKGVTEEMIEKYL